MKLLLDESIPRKLSASFPDTFHVQTVPEMGWSGAKNGKLLQIAAGKQFHALVTADRGMEYQQNLDTLPLSIIILVAYRTRFDDLLPLVPQVVALLERQLAIGIYHVAV